MDRRKVKITAGMSNDCMIILTDAPKKAIEEWCINYNQEMENRENSYFDFLSREFYVKVLHDSEEDPEENIEIIGYSEAYDLFNYVNR